MLEAKLGLKRCAWVGVGIGLSSLTALVALVLGSPGWISSQAQTLADQVDVYTDTLSAGWANWSWDTTLDFDNADPVHEGATSIAVTYEQAWAGLYLHAGAPVAVAGDDLVQFWIHGGPAGGQQIEVTLLDENGDWFTDVNVTPQGGAWTQIEVPVPEWGHITAIGGIVWQDASGGPQPTFYLDDVALVISGVPTPTPGSPVTLTVDAQSGLHPISPYIYGISFADQALAADLRLPLRRWGGNATTRYNWQNDTSNRASDWYFENIPNPNQNPGQLPDGSSSDRFVEQDRATETRSLLTVPLIGWTPKSREFECGFRVSKYGAQEQVDPYEHDCGNGVLLGGTLITDNDPLDTSLPITPTFVSDWIAHLVGRYGTAGQGGVLFYDLDNEPMLWNDTHRDVHPEPASYDEMRERTYAYAAAVKAADPSAQTLGPVVWGWTAYFYSALDWEPGGDWWNHPQDRNAHGGTPFVAWYLQQMQAYETQHGLRLLDYLDLHYYPQAPGVTLAPAGSAATQALRLRSTRSLWDPSYTDESWIAEPVHLIPRMRDWVDQNYPGTKLAITEYNWGALDHINGALAQADVLGIFGREGVDLATLWSPPEFDDPGAFAFRMYRNYDGAGGAFGETSVLAQSADQEQVSVYAALRDDGALTLMAINKSSDERRVSVLLSSFDASSAQVYRYSQADLAILRQPDQLVGDGRFEADLPASSISLFVLPPGGQQTVDELFLPIALR